MTSGRRSAAAAASALVALHLAVLGAGFLAPYSPTAQDRRLPFAPPTRLRFFDPQGRLHLRPFVYPLVAQEGAFGAYREDRSHAYPVRFFTTGASYRIAGILPARIHLLGVDEPARLFLLGSDGLGRDQLARFLHGGGVSLFAGLLAAGLSLGIGMTLGTVAGFYGRRVDTLVMRAAELFFALPWLYLLCAVRAFLPLDLSPGLAFVVVVAVIGLVDWARPARLARGVALVARERDFVLAARGFGAGDFYLIRRHVAPQALGVLVTQAAVLVPQYVLAEVTLSFLGLGVAEPLPSWGNMLAALRQYPVMASYWWMWLPGLALVPVFLAYHALADALRSRSRVLA